MALQINREFYYCIRVVVTKWRQKRYTFFFLGLLLTIFIMFLYSDRLPSYHPAIKEFLASNLTNKYKDYLSVITNNNRRFNGNSDADEIGNDIKRILFWTPYFQVKDFGFGTDQNAFVKAKCPVHNCMTTTDRNLVNQSDALIFHPPDVNIQDLPRHRMAHQRYIFFFFEAHFNYRNGPAFRNPVTNSEFFNWTMTYRRDSDIYDSRYGSIIRRNQSDFQLMNKLPATLSPEESPPDPSSFWQLFEHHSAVYNRTKMVAWFVSNCKTPSRREIFFHQVANYIPIDIFGKCGPLECLPSRSAKCDKLLQDYKFYIVAENSICPDYITEKFYRAMKMGAVPIVYGGADYAAYAPPHSYINAADFESPQTLAEYLLLLDRNTHLYSKYLEWNKDWELDNHNTLDGWCRLCEKLNAPTSLSNPVKIYKDIAKWYYDKVPCLPGTSIVDVQSPTTSETRSATEILK